MNPLPVRVLIAALLVAGMFSTTVADEPPMDEASGPNLAKAVAETKLGLWNVVQTAQSKQRVALRAGFAHDTGGQLVLRILLRSAPDAEADYEEWTGPVSDQGWIPRRRILADPHEIDEAARLHELVGAGPRFLTEAAILASGAERPDKTRPALALTIEPRLEDGERVAVSLVAIDGRLFEVTQSLDMAIILKTRPAGEPPRRVKPDPGAKQRRLPALSVPGGVWFNADTPPTLDTLRGHPVLIAVADPG